MTARAKSPSCRELAQCGALLQTYTRTWELPSRDMIGRNESQNTQGYSLGRTRTGSEPDCTDRATSRRSHYSASLCVAGCGCGGWLWRGFLPCIQKSASPLKVDVGLISHAYTLHPIPYTPVPIAYCLFPAFPLSTPYFSVPPHSTSLPRQQTWPKTYLHLIS